MEQNKNGVFTHFDAKQATRLQKKKLFDYKPINGENDSPLDDSILQVNDNKDIFLEGVVDYLNNHFGKTYKKTDTDDITREVKMLYKNKGIEFKRSVGNWLSWGIKPSQDQPYRINCYNFCFALDMDVNTAAEFLLKYFQIMPFNFKDRIDAIYFYCLQNNKDYNTVKEMLEKAKVFKATNDDSINTQMIGRKIQEIDDDDEFLLYLENQCYDQEHQLRTARNKTIELIEVNKEIANVDSVRRLLKEITGEEEPNVYISKAPDEFKKSFPSNIELSNIINGKNVTDYLLRKALILMKFYNYFKQIDSFSITTKEQIDECRNDFLAEINDLLSECGYVMLYERNLYDEAFYYCLNSEDPIGEFKKIIYKYSLKE